MARYRKRADRALITIPGVGVISDDRVLEGDRFARFCPGLLEQLPAGGPTVPPASPLPPPPRMPSEARQVTEAPVEDSDTADVEEDSGSEEAVDYSEWSYGDLRDEVKRRGLTPEGRTKVDLAEALANDDQ